MSVVGVDCPRNVTINPPSTCRAGTVLTCTADSEPPAQFYWIERHNNDALHFGPTYQLNAEIFNLTCVAYINKTCLPGKPVCRNSGSYADRRRIDTEFPFSLFNFTTPDNGSSASCQARNTFSGYTIGKQPIVLFLKFRPLSQLVSLERLKLETSSFVHWLAM